MSIVCPVESDALTPVGKTDLLRPARGARWLAWIIGRSLAVNGPRAGRQPAVDATLRLELAMRGAQPRPPRL